MALYCWFAVVGLAVAMFVQTNHGQDVRTGQGPPPGGEGRLRETEGEQGPPGGEGVKGDRGDQGPPGGDGAKGVRGEQGQPGGDGAKGDRGDQGPSGGDGAKGDRGDQGPPGEKGSAGETGSPGVSARVNIKQCAWKDLNNGADSGKIVECAFNKVAPTSVLRLTWSGSTRVRPTTACCKRWFFTLNGSECNSPFPIDSLMCTNGASSVNIHRATTIDGLCYNLPAGPVTVALNVGNREGWTECADANTGWNSYSRIIVEEVNIPTGND
ncbi:collagen triple helix repeat-containing protein 1-like [Branchiostoma floridae]|uniref:Collagen triple helix repeat-containing protein 1-like n=1 Tax=Branchiostoma floridae TaxID=7739 RepID=A0A9J7L9W0_BRAFL|nr:collagen triple helix repeat-containing protein 1-like [Branchiostoma floridae]